MKVTRQSKNNQRCSRKQILTGFLMSPKHFSLRMMMNLVMNQ